MKEERGKRAVRAWDVIRHGESVQHAAGSVIGDPAYAEATAGQVGDRRNLGLVKADSPSSRFWLGRRIQNLHHLP